MNRFIDASTDVQALQALVRCRAPEMGALLKLFESVHEKTVDSLLTADDPQRVARLQERALMCKDFLDAVDQAVSLVEKRR